MIVGITGRKGSGKDALAAELTRQAGFYRIALADSLKRVAMDLYDLSYEQCFGSQESKERVDPRWGLSPRQILQRLGTEVGRSVHPKTWIRKMLGDIERARLGFGWVFINPIWDWCPLDTTPRSFVVPDVRFLNEAEAIRQAGGTIIRINRSVDLTDTHPSEVEQESIRPDYVVDNSGDPAQLAREAQAFLAWTKTSQEAG